MNKSCGDPKYSVKRGKTPVLAADEARQLLDAIDTTTLAGLRDRALIALMVYSFARIGAATGMRVEDVFTDQRRLWVRLSEKGGKRHEMPCHHNLVPRHSDFDWLVWRGRNAGKSLISTKIVMLRARLGSRRIRPARSRESTMPWTDGGVTPKCRCRSASAGGRSITSV